MHPDVQTFHDLDAVAADAAGALDRAAQASLFDRLDWYRLTLAHCSLPGRPLILRADVGGTCAWLFLMIDDRAARPLASWYSLATGFVHQTPDQAEKPDAMTAIAARLRRERITHLTLAPLATAIGDTHAAFRAAGWTTALTPATVARTVAVADWSTYWAARPGPLRETVRRKSRCDPFRIEILTRFDPAAWDAYEAVYARSWKPAEGSPAFLRALAEQESAAGTLRLGLAYDGPRPVAAQFWLVEDGRATIHKLAHDEADRARSPGTLLSHAMFRHAIEVDRVALIDFGTGNDAYKADWMDTATPLWRLDAWNLAHPRGLAGYARHRAGQLVRTLRTRYAAAQQRRGAA